MKTIRRPASAAVLVAGMLITAAAAAQSSGVCPSLPEASGLAWKELQSPGLVFCKALRDSDGAEVFAVTIADKSPFKPNRSDRDNRTSIDGHDGYWYRSEVASAPAMQVRETLIELSDGRVAHLTVRAASRDLLPAAIQQAEAVRFPTTLVSSK